MPVPSMLSLIIAATVILSVTSHGMAASPLATLPRTGQTNCWDTAGAQITCGGTGQDGDKLAGISLPDARFSDNGDGTVTDALTGLVWLKNANCFNNVTWEKALSSVNNLTSGTCSLTDGSKSGAWRLPNRKEMQSLLNRQQSNNSLWLASSGFLDVQENTYWTSSTTAVSDSYSWNIDAKESRVNVAHKIKNLCYVWPVRTGR